jgi:hypothetical protein
MSAIRCLSFPAPDRRIAFKRHPEKATPNQECRQGAMVADKFIKAQPRHIEKSDCSRTAVQVWGKLCDHRDGTNETFVSTGSLAAACRVSVRTARRAIEELRQKGWLCLPNGDSGGRPRERNVDSKPAATFQVHPFGQGCRLPSADLKQRRARPDMVEVNRRRWGTESVIQEPQKDDKNDDTIARKG